MDNSSITMEEYIMLEEKKTRRHGKVYNWETAKYGKIWYDEDVHDLRSIETEFPAIVFNDELSSEKTLSCEPTTNDALTSKSDFLTEPILCPQHIDEFDLKDETSLSKYDEVKQNVLYFNDLFPFNIIHPDDLKSDMTPLPPHDQRHLWLRYQVEGYIEEIVHDFEQRLETIFGRQVNRVHILDFEGLTPDMRQDLAEKLRMVYTGDDGQEVFMSHAWRRLFEIRAPLVHEFLLEFFSTCRIGSEIGHAEGRKSGVRLSRGHFIGRLAHHFGLVSDDGLRGLSVVTRELPSIDMGELVKLNICIEVGDNWAWVAQGAERQPVATAAAPDIDEGLRQDVRSLRGLVERSMTNQGRFSTWMVSCMTQLMEASGRTYQEFDRTFRGSYPKVFERRTRRRTDGASTSTSQQDEQQPNP
ncbi:hypothetical protein Tco_1068490 [Tanacetum coccineum]|uniref:Uncharacterized protein n=1 Tax=Tanacetum coccineum TaxID=301880 RepID=A0ABQ5HFV6_9ASTR